MRTDLRDGLGKAIGANPSCPLDPLPSVMQPWEPPTITCSPITPLCTSTHQNNPGRMCTCGNLLPQLWAHSQLATPPQPDPPLLPGTPTPAWCTSTVLGRYRYIYILLEYTCTFCGFQPGGGKKHEKKRKTYQALCPNNPTRSCEIRHSSVWK